MEIILLLSNIIDYKLRLVFLFSKNRITEKLINEAVPFGLCFIIMMNE